ncbi:MAG: ABC transporter permease [Candidatus Thermoplasmatota archaeon]|nr:ABC transporter permease [Candidatus Thermoplasmatota archaeon]
MLLSAVYVTIEEEDKEESINSRVLAEIEQKDFDDPNDAYEYREKRIQELKEEHNLDEPRIKRIFYSAVDLVTFDFGKSERYAVGGGREISAVIMAYLPYTILLFTSGAAIYSLIGILIGLKAAQFSRSKLDKIITLVSATSSSVPLWWAGMIFLVIFSYMLGWYPRPSPFFPYVKDVGYLGYIKELLIKMSLPLFTLILVKFGASLWTSRNIASRILQDDYIMAARSKGIPERRVIYGHTLKTAAPPIMTNTILALLTSFGGFLIAEVVFQWPGIGYLLRRALFESSTSYLTHGTSVFEQGLISAIVFILVVISIIGLYIADILYGLLDPRIEVGSQFSKEGK